MNLEHLIQIIISIHAALGGVALLTGTTLLFLRKGTARHKLLGRVFFYAMVISCFCAILISVWPNHHNPFLLGIGIFSTYLLLTGKRAIRYPKLSEGKLSVDKAISGVMVLTAIAMIVGDPLRGGSFNMILSIFGTLGLWLSLRDLSLYKKLDTLKKSGLRLHIGKMIGGYIASVTAFIVVNEFIPGIAGWILPTILGSIYISFAIRKFTKKPHAAVWLLLAILSLEPAYAQVYTEKQTRHRFAQLNLGLDYQTHTQGKSSFVNPSGGIESFDLSQNHIPRVIIGGTHFWGHADFYIAIPLLYPEKEVANQLTTFGSSIETVFKYYPWYIEANKVRPYVGVSISPYYFIQDNQLLDFGSGPELRHTSAPLLFGLTYNKGNHLIELGATWNYNNEQSYYVNRELTSDITTPPVYLNLSYRYFLDTTLGAEKDWESGETARITEILASRKKLNSWFVGMGMSSAFWLGESEYNQVNRPYKERYGISLFPDVSLGHYFHKADMNAAVSYRSYSHRVETYGTDQLLKRRSVGGELTKFLFDYHGFVPFLGPIVSSERLSFKESFENQLTQDRGQNKWAWGLVFGWDIRPDRLQSWILRTNLRWYPSLNLETDSGQTVNFSNLEFNFIQLVVYPGRFF